MAVANATTATMISNGLFSPKKPADPACSWNGSATRTMVSRTTTYTVSWTVWMILSVSGWAAMMDRIGRQRFLPAGECLLRAGSGTDEPVLRQGVDDPHNVLVPFEVRQRVDPLHHEVPDVDEFDRRIE